MGTALELSDGDGPVHRTYVTGDTLFRPWRVDVSRRTGPIDAMVAHLGGTRALGLLVTTDAGQGADLVELLSPGVTVPVHYDDYTVFRSPRSTSSRSATAAVSRADCGSRPVGSVSTSPS